MIVNLMKMSHRAQSRRNQKRLFIKTSQLRSRQARRSASHGALLRSKYILIENT